MLAAAAKAVSSCKAYSSISQCSIKGADQKSDVFKEIGCAKFQDLYTREYPCKFCRRGTILLLSCIGVQIAATAQKYIAIVDKMPEQSGKSKKDFDDRCMDGYALLYKKNYTTAHCLPFLNDMPKTTSRKCPPSEKCNALMNGAMSTHTLKLLALWVSRRCPSAEKMR